MNRQEMLTACKTSNPEYAEKWKNICEDSFQKEDNWVKQLRLDGVSAAHPDDGWIDRENNTVIFCYPQFSDKVEVGSVVALGDADRFRLVHLTEIVPSLLGLEKWKFQQTTGEQI